MRILSTRDNILIGEVVTLTDIKELVEKAKAENFKGFGARTKDNRWFNAEGEQVEGVVYFEKVVETKPVCPVVAEVKQNKVEIFKSKVNALKEDNKKLLAENNQLKNDLVASKNTVKNLNDETKLLTKVNNDYSTKIKALEVEVNNLKEENVKLATEKQELEKVLDLEI